MSGVGRDLCGSPSPTPCQSRVTYSRLHRTLSRRGLNISREGDSTTSLGSRGRGSVTLRGKKFFLVFRWNFLWFSLCPLPLVQFEKKEKTQTKHQDLLWNNRKSRIKLKKRSSINTPCSASLPPLAPRHSRQQEAGNRLCQLLIHTLVFDGSERN